MPQGSILGPLLFLVQVNNLNKASDVLDSIIFSHDTNLFYSHQNIETLSRTVNCELEKICEWFTASKYSLNVIKSNFTLFHKNFTKNKLPLKMPELKIGNSVIKRKWSVKFLRMMLDESISLKHHIKTFEKKNLPKIFVYYIAPKQYLDEMSLKTIYFSSIH